MFTGLPWSGILRARPEAGGLRVRGRLERAGFALPCCVRGRFRRATRGGWGSVIAWRVGARVVLAGMYATKQVLLYLGAHAG